MIIPTDQTVRKYNRTEYNSTVFLKRAKKLNLILRSKFNLFLASTFLERAVWSLLPFGASCCDLRVAGFLKHK